MVHAANVLFIPIRLSCTTLIRDRKPHGSGTSPPPKNKKKEKKKNDQERLHFDAVSHSLPHACGAAGVCRAGKGKALSFFYADTGEKKSEPRRKEESTLEERDWRAPDGEVQSARKPTPTGGVGFWEDDAPSAYKRTTGHANRCQLLMEPISKGSNSPKFLIRELKTHYSNECARDTTHLQYEVASNGPPIF